VIRFKRTACLLGLLLFVLTPCTVTAGTLGAVIDVIDLGGPPAWGQMDVGADDLIVLQTPASTLSAYVKSGMNHTDLENLTTWDGWGIVTSAGREANITAGYDRYSLAVVLNGDFTKVGIQVKRLFDGVSVDKNAVFVAYSLNGDANLDGYVNYSDYNSWLRGYLGNKVTGWLAGDFNYDGHTDAKDLAVLQAAGLNVTMPTPEPAALTLLAIGMLAFAVHSSRRRKVTV
jgi:hypothetical protein